ncbi:AAA family ATPase [uncultured Cellulomonas sp.]|uniref:AAA family ATPase n=1 Tax=uncultured Cellulomonas sp. TaxID=189682 RepID=UPI002621B758|nr:AAA family ATPase [uncultured Cellulomonas sp.]
MKRTTTGTPAAATQAPAPRPPAEHLRNPVLARALLAVWSGDPALVIDSPPGAGKTHLNTHLAHQLRTRAGMTVAIAAQTRAQAADVAHRTAATGADTALLIGANNDRPADTDPAIRTMTPRAIDPGAGIVVATTARWTWLPHNRPVRFDVLLIDEAYQLTFADLGTLGAIADQFVLVGDPGQIDPVITGTTRRWDTWASGPHVPAPTALAAAHHDDVTTLRLPQTWRLGPATTALLAPLYPSLPFTSARPPSHLSDHRDQPLPEYHARPITITGGTPDPVIAVTAADTARDLLTRTLHTTAGTRPLAPEDVAVIAPHVEQAALIAAALADLPGIFVGTINQAQGLERHAVVAVHPLAGHADALGVAADLGRLCVALSRHRSHLTVITDKHTPAVLDRAHRDQPGTQAVVVHQRILDSLLAA